MLATTAFKLQVHVTVSASAIYNKWNSKLDKKIKHVISYQEANFSIF